ncbi:MAG TPA: hypothetical protein VFG28_05265 [Syntrophales bacterium]|nr:hypothetical protein [Syntrophales bacterium]
MGKKFNWVSICLIAVLGFRSAVHIEPALASLQFGSVIALSLYLIPLIGVILRRRWGPIMSGIVGILDLVMTLLYVRGTGIFGAVLVDAALVILSYLDYRRIVMKERARSVANPADPIQSEAQSESG